MKQLITDRFGAFCLGVLAVVVAVLSTGCASVGRPLEIVPLKQKGATIVPKFTESYYYYDRDKTLYFILRSNTTDQSTGKPVEQIATFRVFWRPVGGKTSLNPTSIDATYRYAVITPDAVGMYEGAGFVRLWGKEGVHKLEARVYAGDLRLTQASSKFVDTIGRGQMQGNFTVIYDDVRATDMLLAAQQEFFERSLLGPAATEPATGPSTMPAGTQP